MFIIVTIIVGLASLYHPIIFKLLTGSARLLDRPVNAIVYTDGKINNDIKVYHVDKYWNGQPADYYVLYFAYAVKSRLKFLSLNKKDNYAGIPVSANIRDYDIVAGFLIQSETGGNFTPMQDDMKGLNFEPGLTFINGQVLLIIPPAAKELKCDSLQVIL